MFTEFKEIKKAFFKFFIKSASSLDADVDDVYIPCCGNKDDIVSADYISLKDAFLEYCGINLVEVVTLMSPNSLTKFVNFRIKYFSEGIDHELEISIKRMDMVHTIACIKCNKCLGAYIVHSTMYPEYLTCDNYIGSAEEYFDKIFVEKEKSYLEKNKKIMIEKERVKRAREICGFK